jgi:hypothetical protein
MSRLEIDCNMEAEWPLDCRRKAKKLKGALQGTGGDAEMVELKQVDPATD